jgi:hypothetical protein
MCRPTVIDASDRLGRMTVEILHAGDRSQILVEVRVHDETLLG